MVLPPEIIARRDNGQRGSKLGNIVRRLGSNSEADLLTSIYAVQRLLESCGTDMHALAEHIEAANGALTDADKEKIRVEIERAYTDGYAEGVRAAESKQHGTGAFRNTDGTLEWTEVALFVQREKHRLSVKHHEFVDDMASRTVYGREPTPNQHKYLHSLFYKLGGKIT
jgi:hypothetical protein